MRRLLLACSVALSICAAGALAQTGPTIATRQVGTATLQNVPEIPADVTAAVQRYQNYRMALFQDWLADGSILIATRFGSTQQIHRVTAPGGDRTQVTFQNEPVAGAVAIPGTQRFVFTRDTGGDEWFQLYTMGLTGEPVSLTEPKTRNQSYAFSKDGRLLAWARALKGSGDYAILTADPANPASRRVVYQGKGSWGVADISADKSRILLERGISNRETRLALLNLATGVITELSWTKEPARYEGARFTADGSAIDVITDYRSDFRKLVEDVLPRPAKPN